MTRVRLRPLVFALACAAWAKPASAQYDLSRVDSVVTRGLAQQGIPGASIYVGTIGGRTLLARGYGTTARSNGRAMSAAEIFPMRSVSKTFTATLVVRLAQAGLVQLDAPIGRYLAELPSWRDSVTVRQLLTHTSGVLSFDDLPRWSSWRDSARTPDAVIARIASTPLLFAPGSKFRYSNTGYEILAELVEHATGQTYPDALRQRLLDPLGLREIVPCYRAAQQGRLGSGNVDRGDSLAVYSLNAGFRADSTLASGGLCASATQIGQFMAALARGAVVGRDGLSTMLTVPAVGARAGAGAGLFRSTEGTHPIWQHSGGCTVCGVSSNAAVYPDDSLVVVVLLNANRDPEAITRHVARAAVRLPEPRVVDLATDSAARGRFVGVYAWEGGRVIVVERNGQLFAMGQRLLHQGGDTLVGAVDTETRLVFSDEGDGRAARVELLHYGSLVATGVRTPPATPERKAQQPDPLPGIIASLRRLPGTISAHYPDGAKARAEHVQRMLEQALPFYRAALGRDIKVSVALLGPAEWRAWNTQYTAPGGAPFSSMLPGVERLPDGERVMLLPAESGHALSAQVRRLWMESRELRALGPSPDSVADRFATLVGIHELGHVYTAADSIRPSEAWFNELLATYLAYAFLRARDPDDARFWQAVSDALLKGLRPQQTSLAQMFGRGADTYVWYQASLQSRAREVYDAHGLDFYRRVKEQRAVIGDTSRKMPLVQALEQIAPGFLAWQRRYHSDDSLPKKR